MDIKVIVGVVLVKDNKILMVQEGKSHCFKKWNLPGGHLEYGENIMISATREVYEETGYKIKIKNLVGVYNYISPTENHCLLFNFIGEITGGELKFDGKEILNVKWFSLDELRKTNNSQIRAPKIIRKIIEDVEKDNVYSLRILKDFLK